MTNVTPTFDNNTERYTGPVCFGPNILAANTYYCTAPWQRNYAWLVPHCHELLKDILVMLGYFKENQNQPHLVGEMILTRIKQNVSELDGADVIEIGDGQQRLTSILLLLLAIRDVAEELKEKNSNKKDYYEDIIDIVNRNIFLKVNGKKILRIKLNNIDNKVINELVFNKNYKEDLDLDLLNAENNPEKCRIIPNYRFFVRSVHEYIQSGHPLKELVTIIPKMLVTLTYCRTSLDALAVYYSKNTKGIRLASYENAKALLIGLYEVLRFTNDNHIVDNKGEKRWAEIENKVGLENMKLFLTDAIILFNEYHNTRQNNIVPDHLCEACGSILQQMDNQLPNKDNQIPNPVKADMIFDMIEEYAEIYDKYISANMNIDFDTATELQKSIYLFEKVARLVKYNSTIMYLLNKMDKNELKEDVLINVLNAILVYQVRRKIGGSSDFRNPGYNDAIKFLTMIRKEFNQKDKVKHADKLDYFIWEKFQLGRGSKALPDNNTIKARYSSNQLGNDITGIINHNRVMMKYVIYCINKKMAEEKGLALPKFKEDYVLEMIVSDNNIKSWVEDLNFSNKIEIDKYKHRLGNYVLVERPTDERIFANRQATYRNSEFPVAKMIGETKDWNKTDIKYLTQFYIGELCKIFAIPKKYKLKKA